ncbi:acyl-CoA dehydrogenase [Flavipsychrobacter stenotrophus]|uniref:Acyl-CoA dehydrogenase n=1 Tax=Flavipsychrobacter stenotrophus TaxID=2077091 RepID=A0A2S7SVH0_9BACT|nr:acyl-CoA dehydrogenase family protein [Flavipsychrobacter stenotrophus]PQJ10708.1 acyl-CoA dehydrogenase [Flavipsychrobacter stenotrophus]
MASTMASIQGGGFLIQSSTPENTFTPEDFNEEQLMIAAMCTEFLEKDVLPHLNEIDDKKEGLMQELLDKAGSLGLLGAGFPEAYGGLGEDFITSTLITEQLGGGHSFIVAMTAHNGIGSLPILYFGTEAQKQQYMPKLATGEMKGAYALTEPGSGSDALGAKTTAVLSADGNSYVLNGQKIWITNAGFADVFTVFAKIDGVQFTAFIVERGTPGLSYGEEEHKMGIKGSSTRQLFFENCVIPKENLLGEIGKGHVIAFNILNIGRLKLCAATSGGAKLAVKTTVAYAKTREQFKQPIANFGAIQHKLAEMVIKLFAADSAMYRTAKWIDDKENALAADGKHDNALLGAAEEYAIECAILKVLGSEALDYVVDEGVQIHGGNGFSDEYNISRAYRDARINRIFEGTNEINRLLILDMYLKRAMKGRINIMGAAMDVQKEMMSIPDFSADDTPFAAEQKVVANFKKAILMCAGGAAQKLMMQLEHEQEILMNLADMAIDTFQAESVLLRAMKMKQDGNDLADVAMDIAHTFLYDAADRINHAGKAAINGFAEGDEQRMMLMGIKRFTKADNYNTKDARRRIAAVLIEKGQYFF